jgi:4'-phosphopantetheinyl transferase
MDERWLTPPPTLALPPGELHLWRATLDQSEAIRERLWGYLSDEEQERAGKFRFDNGRFHYIVGRGLLRQLLGSYLAAPPHSLRFASGPNGKPHLIDYAQFSFNVAHGQGRLLLGFCRGADLGVDIEQIRLPQRADGVARRFFAPAEYVTFAAAPPEQQAEVFFNCWTRKEAYIKATGEGLACPLNAFEVSLAVGETAVLHSIRGSAELAAAWSLYSLTPYPGYRGAALAAGPGWQVVCYDGDGLMAARVNHPPRVKKA